MSIENKAIHAIIRTIFSYEEYKIFTTKIQYY